jgi:hypothetical protein
MLPVPASDEDLLAIGTAVQPLLDLLVGRGLLGPDAMPDQKPPDQKPPDQKPPGE